jgi:RNA polymerase sigma factor (sigma-70 family)
VGHAQLEGVVRHVRAFGRTEALSEAPDAQLLQRFAAAREEGAFTALLRRHGPMVLGVSRRVLGNAQDAEDVYQAAFLLLARKAAAIRKREAVASWLYGVARRLALKAKAQGAKRQARERRAADMRNTQASADADWPDVQAALEAALEELPEGYRAALVSCYLEGKTHAEAARHLGCPLATLRTRIARGRKLLRERLAGRGLALSGAGLFALLVASSTLPAAPAPLLKATAKAALSFAAGQPAAKLCTGRVAELVEEGTQTMLLSKTKLATALLLTAGLLAGTGALARLRPAAAAEEPPAARKAEAPKSEAAKPEGAKPAAPAVPDDDQGDIAFAGRVLGPDGKPFAGARLHLLYYTPKALPVPARATSDAEGRFRFSVARADFDRTSSAAPWDQATLVAVAKGFGMGVPEVRRGKATPRTDLTLRLAKEDAPLRGRVLDLQGKPAAGVAVRVHALYAPLKGDLTDFVTTVKDKQEIYPAINEGMVSLSGGWMGRDVGTLFAPVKTDAAGRFEVPGVGRERVVELRFEAPLIATTDVFVMTRPGATLRLPGYRQYMPRTTMLTLHGNGFDHVAGAGKPVVGVVRDHETGKPIPGAVVTSFQRAGDPISFRTDLRTVADKEGRFRLLGMPKGEGNVIRAGPREGAPYLAVTRRVGDTPGLDAVTVDVQLKRGVWINGRVIDQVTRRPVHAQIAYGVFEDNPHRKEVPGWSVDIYLQTRAADGTFRFVGVPGRGVLAARALGDQFRMAVGADKIKGLEADGHFRTYPGLIYTQGYHGLIEINPAKDAKEYSCEIALDPGRSLKGVVVGPDGRPLAGARASNLKSYGYWEYNPLATAEFTVTGVEPGKPRLVQFAHLEKNLAGFLVVKGDEKGPLKVKLGPAAVLTGRLVTPDGQPVTEGQIITRGDPLGAPAKAKNAPLSGSFPNGVRPDKDGKFRIAGLAPGLTCKLGLHRDVYLHEFGGAAGGELTFKPGETKDLGDVVVKPVD